jgi:hypothetical protein
MRENISIYQLCWGINHNSRMDSGIFGPELESSTNIAIATIYYNVTITSTILKTTGKFPERFFPVYGRLQTFASIYGGDRRFRLLHSF